MIGNNSVLGGYPNGATIKEYPQINIKNYKYKGEIRYNGLLLNEKN
jgi:hypothetical protein